MPHRTTESVELYDGKSPNVTSTKDLNYVATKKEFLPLLSDITKSTSSVVDGKQLDHSTDERTKKCTFIPLLPLIGTARPTQRAPNCGTRADFVSPGSPSADVQNAGHISSENRKQVVQASAQKDNAQLVRPKPTRRYEWPLIINGVYQGEGPLPSCRIEDDDSPTESRPYSWPLIILRADSVENCDQQPVLESKEENGTPADREDEIDEPEPDAETIDESGTMDCVCAGHHAQESAYYK